MEYKSPYKQLNRKVNTWCNYTKRIDTYGNGCQHACKYCYAKSLLDFRGHWNEKQPGISNLNTILSCIRGLNSGDVVRIGSMTDCFQPLEKKEMLTYKTIKLLNHYKIHYLIVTKSDLVSQDKYIDIYDKKLAHFQVTITSTDDEKCLQYENAPVISKRIKSIEKLYKLGFDVNIRLSPFIEKNVDLKVLNNIKCNKILIEFLKVNHWVKKWFDIDYSDYSLSCGGYNNLQLKKKIELVNRVNNFDQISVGEYVQSHHKYFSENVNFNKKDCCNLDITSPLNFNQTTLF